MLLGEGRGFEIAQGRLGPGRIHHCMRLIGAAERALERMCRRAQLRVTFGRPVADQTVTQERIAEARIMIEQSRLLTLKAAYMMDTVGNKVARKEIAMIKVAAPNMACHGDRLGDAGLRRRGDHGRLRPRRGYANARLLRLADGPDEVHRNQIARLELKPTAHRERTRAPTPSCPRSTRNPASRRGPASWCSRAAKRAGAGARHLSDKQIRGTLRLTSQSQTRHEQSRLAVDYRPSSAGRFHVHIS